ncbi:MAG: endonuclease/exonuclease/phosphatase family protein [Bacteroidales bacterium]|nr:endonuclease/exonuclease/phosphatase family protein [Bacteroidales bacterium]
MKNILFSIFFILLSFTGVAKVKPSFNIATYNIRNDNKGDSINGNGWGERVTYISQMVLFHQFDIFGTQEGKKNQLEDMKNNLPDYDYIGVGRDDGKDGGEFCAIFYNTKKFKKIDDGNFWLSTETSYPNKGWDAALPRICTWGKFKDLKSGFTFIYYNLHMDHIGVEARSESAKLILKKITEEPKKTAVILSGDFNVDQFNESYLLLNNSGLLKDSYETTEFRYAPNGTFNNFNPGLKTNKRIDHIFLTKDFKVKKYGVLTDTYRSEKENQNKGGYARTPSDHFPVMISVEVKK